MKNKNVIQNPKRKGGKPLSTHDKIWYNFILWRIVFKLHHSKRIK